MELDKLRFAINEDGIINEKEKDALFASYKELFKEIYGYDILSKYEKEKSKIKNSCVFDDVFINAIDVLKSVQEDDCLSLLMIYNASKNIIGFARIKEINENIANNRLIGIDNLFKKNFNQKDEKRVSISDLAVVPEYSKYKYDIWKKSVSFVESLVTIQGFDRLYVEIPINSPLLFRADDLGFIEDCNDIPISYMPITRILNKSLERDKNEKFNTSR